ncbi:MAG: hypothetical protein IJ493_05135 [Clostridia bacterium]|nr:hypothetical protein [Clostridia bacterium]
MIDIRKTFGRFKKGAKAVGAASVDPLCKLIASVGFAMFFTEIGCFLLDWIVGDVAPKFLYVIPLLSFAAGYAVQGLVLLAFPKKRTNDYAYESTQKYFDRPRAAPALILAVIAALISKDMFFQFFLSLVREGKFEGTMDSYSLQPFLCAFVLFISAAAGSVIQFMPYHRIMSYRGIIVCSCITVVLVIVSGFSQFIGVCYAVYICCAVIIANQSHIMRAYQSLTVTKITPSARMYNLRTILLALLICAGACAMAYIFVAGLWRILEMLFLFVLYTLLRDRGGATGEHQYPSYSSMGEMSNNDSFIGIFQIVGAVLMIGLLLIFLIFGRTMTFRGFLDGLKRWFNSFIASFMSTEVYEKSPEINYRDTVETVAVPKKSRVQRAMSRGRLTLHDFNSELSSLKSMEEKLEYSYAVILSLLSDMNLDLRVSDTPRELSHKIENGTTFGQIGVLTDIIERIKYADRPADGEDAERLLNDIRHVIANRL